MSETWPQSDGERAAYADWQGEVANGDTLRGFRDWLTARAEAAATRIAYYTNEGFFDPGHGYIVAQIVEDEAGYAVWEYRPTLAEAKAAVAANNARIGIGEIAMLEIVVSSMRLGDSGVNRGSARR